MSRENSTNHLQDKNMFLKIAMSKVINTGFSISIFPLVLLNSLMFVLTYIRIHILIDTVTLMGGDDPSIFYQQRALGC